MGVEKSSELFSFATGYLTIAYELPPSLPVYPFGTSFPAAFVTSGLSPQIQAELRLHIILGRQIL